MNIVIPMAGRGSRLAGHWSGVSKPYIEVRGRPLWWWAATCLPSADVSRLVLVAQRKDAAAHHLEDAAAESFPGTSVAVHLLDDVTDGQLCTVLAARDKLDPGLPLLVYNADTWFVHDEPRFRDLAARHDGTLGVARKPGDRWSFARLGADGLVAEVVEKKRVSDLACTGLYHFASTAWFLREGDAMVAEGDRSAGEFYVAPLYQRLIDAGGRVTTIEASEFLPIGTPEELATFERRLESPS